MTKTTNNGNGLTETKVLFARIDERTKNLEKELKSISTKLDRDYVTKEEFDPVKTAVYGLIGIILITVVGYLLKLVIS